MLSKVVVESVSEVIISIYITYDFALRLIALHEQMCSLNFFPRELLFNRHLESPVHELWQRKLNQQVSQLALVSEVSTSQPASFLSQTLVPQQIRY
jgi:hypothetical protein